jgi:Starch-binding associating with outer membrane
MLTPLNNLNILTPLNNLNPSQHSQHVSTMKHLFFKITGLFGLILLLVGCSDFLDINEDISNPQTAQAPSLLPPMFADMARGEQFDARFVGQYVQNWTSSASGNVWDAHGFVAANDGNGEKWRSHYFGLGQNIDLMLADAVKTGRTDYAGVAKALRGWSWQTTTDHHGDMIVKQMFEPGRFIFDFDTQEDAYKMAEQSCMEALEFFSRPGPGASVASLAKGDLVYKGDAKKWERFTYGVLARLANHISNKASYNPAKVIEYCDKSLIANTDNFAVPFNGANTTDANFYGPLRNNLSVLRQSTFIVSLLDSVAFKAKDPRAPIMLTASPDGKFRGVASGAGDGTTNQSATTPAKVGWLWGGFTRPADKGAKYVFRDDAPYPLMTYAEIQFIKAEAAFKSGDKTMAYGAFTKGITAHMDYAGVKAADRDKYLKSAAVPQKADDLTLSDIMLQKYIALWAIGAAETWVDLRRYKYDKAVYTGFSFPATFAVTNDGKPAQRARPRFNSEYLWNAESLRKIGADLPGYHTVEMWFSKP